MSELLGTWQLVSCEHRLQIGGKLHPLGQNAMGQLTYTAEGLMSVSLMASQRTLFKGTGLFEGTDPERAAAAQSYVSYAGRYEILADRVIHHVDFSLFPNWVGTRQERFYQREGETLTLSTPPFTAGGLEQTAVLIWKRPPQRGELRSRSVPK